VSTPTDSAGGRSRRRSSRPSSSRGWIRARSGGSRSPGSRPGLLHHEPPRGACGRRGPLPGCAGRVRRRGPPGAWVSCEHGRRPTAHQLARPHACRSELVGARGAVHVASPLGRLGHGDRGIPVPNSWREAASRKAIPGGPLRIPDTAQSAPAAQNLRAWGSVACARYPFPLGVPMRRLPPPGKRAAGPMRWVRNQCPGGLESRHGLPVTLERGLPDPLCAVWRPRGEVWA